MDKKELLTNANSTFESVVADAVQSVIDGETEAHNVVFALKSAQKVIDEALTMLEEAWLAEAQNYADTKGAFTLCGKTCKIVEGNKKDYSVCGDSQWETLRNACDTADEQRKAREKFLQGVPIDGMTVVDETTGEVSKIFPPRTVGKTYVRISDK